MTLLSPDAETVNFHFRLRYRFLSGDLAVSSTINDAISASLVAVHLPPSRPTPWTLSNSQIDVQQKLDLRETAQSSICRRQTSRQLIAAITRYSNNYHRAFDRSMCTVNVSLKLSQLD